MSQKKIAGKMDRRSFVKSSTLGLALLASPPGICKAQADALSWESIMGQSWERPKKLNVFAGVHPRLFLNDARIESLRRKISTTHRGIWEIVKEKADSYLDRMPPSDYNTQRDMREAGRGIPWQCLAYLVSGNTDYLEGAKKWIATICKFPRWEQNHSLSGGECLFGVAIGYDWLFKHLSEEERKLIREKLVYQAGAMRSGPPVHHDVWLANHNHVEHNGLAAAGFALYDEVPEAIEWIRQADLVFRAMFNNTSNDGSSTEGHQYWGYTMEAVLRYAEAAKDLLGADYYGSQWLKSVPDFVIHSTIPDFNAENCVMSFGDSHRNYASHGPTHILYRLAAEYKNVHAQWLAKEMDRRNVGRGDYCTWTSLLWYDERVQSLPLSRLPTFWNCEDIGWITSRSKWDGNAVMVGFKCGPMHGHKVQPYYGRQYDEKWADYHSLGGGHGHPDVNSFQIYAYGKWLAIDPGYESPKPTATHNTALINGQGQLGGGTTWFDRNAVIGARASSAIIRAETEATYEYLIGNAKNIYPASAALSKFYRHFLYIKPDVIVIVDELKSNRPSLVEWLLHTEIGFDKNSQHHYLAKNGGVGMDVHFLLPDKFDTKVDVKTLKLSAELNPNALIVTVLHPRKLTAAGVRTRLETYRESRLRVFIESEERKTMVKLDLARQEVSVSSGT
ncbi:MAG TPA: DUF4962 domain-containing protein [Acidobacteriota bacterium]|jgi:hypothetical protein